ncbi:MAG: YerC/YecD family TrpR-related protein [Alphaproteobacteria bacterium]|nr:YerC/YecD family TrpR-related protein [Alphaproteobacteria bacterium]
MMAVPQDKGRAEGADTALYAALLSLETAEEVRDFLADLCTPRELAALVERWQIVRYLDSGDLSYRDISARTGASTTTIGRVARFLLQERHCGYRRILDRLKKK